MTNFDYFLWLIVPYISLTIFVVGHIYRYNTDQFGWSAKSSEFIEKDGLLKWGSNLFHYGITFVFFGHVGGILIPKPFFDAIGVTEEMYHLGAITFGIAAGIAMLVGGALLTIRRISSKRVKRNSSRMDLFVLLLLGVVTIAGFSSTIGYTATGYPFDYRTTIGPWFRGILSFRPVPELMVGAPIGFQLHILAAFALFAIFPFTRLVHMWSLPLEYLTRKYVIYRKATPRKALRYMERK